ncbi:MAG: nitrous oxide reductase family maturation protein NosD [Dehalococcoidia bacterium]
MKQAISLLLALALVLSLGLVTGMPVGAASTTWYVVEGGAGNQTGADWANAFATIQAGIGSSGPGDTIEVAAGTYVEDLVIPTGKDGLEIAGVYTTVKPIIEGITHVDYYPGRHNINILSSGVKLHGFTIKSPDVPADRYSGGIHLDSPDVEIYDNDFVLRGHYCVAIQTWRVNITPGADISGLKIYGNTFGGTADRYQAVFLNRDTGVGIVTVENNEFSANIVRAIATERSNTVIRGNEMTGEIVSHGITVRDWDGRQQENVEITGNTVGGFSIGMVIGQVGQVLTDIEITGNTIKDNGTGIRVDSSAGGVMVSLNDIVGNTGLGVSNTDTVRLNARYNWWGHQTGPDHNELNLGGQGDAVGDDVHIGPWLYRPHEQFVSGAPCYAGSVLLASEATQVTVNNVTSYQGGWNSFSTPIALDSSANTVSKLLALTTGSGLFIERAQRFDPAAQEWVAIIMGNHLVGPDYTIRPGEGFFIQVRSAGSIPILVRSDLTEPTTRNLVAGWNLIGLSSLQAQTVTTALSGVDYSFVLSPGPPNAEAWIVPPDGAGEKFMLVGEAYWVAMSQPGILFVTTTTPVADDMTWDLNQLD